MPSGFLRLSRKSPLIAWLAICVLLLQAISPAWAKASSASPLAVQLCSAHGAKTIYLDLKGDAGKTHQSAQQNCHCCLTGAAAPPLAIVGLALGAVDFQFPFAIETHDGFLPPDASARWQARLKQAPPLLS